MTPAAIPFWSFPAAGPVEALVSWVFGDIRIVASPGAELTVEVRPANPNKAADVAGAQRVVVALTEGRLEITMPKSLGYFPAWGRRERVDLALTLPPGSSVRARAAAAPLHATGPLGQVAYRTAMGDIEVEAAQSVNLRTQLGEIVIGAVDGATDARTAQGGLRIGRIGGIGRIHTAHGKVSVGEVTGELVATTAHGPITVDRADGSVELRTSHGSIGLGNIGPGQVSATTAYGAISLGVRSGVAAQLELRAQGAVESELGQATGPETGDEIVHIRARTALGGIAIRRATA